MVQEQITCTEVSLILHLLVGKLFVCVVGMYLKSVVISIRVKNILNILQLKKSLKWRITRVILLRRKKKHEILFVCQNMRVTYGNVNI